MSLRRSAVRIALTAWVVAGGAAILATACSSPNASQISTLTLPDRTEFTASVSPFMEARCGSLDCHGQIGRPLRLYSQYGLRQKRADGGVRDTGPTTDAERTANYFAVVGLEPEDISRSRESKGQFVDFLLLKKPISVTPDGDGDGVRHKGGQVLRSTDPGFNCLFTWIADKVSAPDCDRAYDKL